MFKKIIPFILLSVTLGCVSQSRDITYKDYIMNRDFSVDRSKQLSSQEIDYECSIIVREVKGLNADINSSVNDEETRAKAMREIDWFKRRASKISCKDKSLEMQNQPHADNEHDSQLTNIKGEVQDTSTSKPGHELSFDECYSKCKELTSRTNEVCFDTCISADKYK